MKKHDLCKLALLGISLGLCNNLQAEQSDFKKDSANSLLEKSQDQYICSAYQNCGKCGGSCETKNPKTPGFTKEQVEQAEKYQKEHADKGQDQQSGPSAPGKEKCGTFCASSTGDDSTSDNSSSMRAKRNSLR